MSMMLDDGDLAMTDAAALSLAPVHGLGSLRLPFADASGPPSENISDDDDMGGSGSGSGAGPALPIGIPEGVGEDHEDQGRDQGRDQGQDQDQDQDQDEDEALHIDPHPLLPTGCYYDDRMRYHMHPDMSSQSHHPEDPRRIQEIWNAFIRAGLVFAGTAQRLSEIELTSPNRYMHRIQTREATAEEVTLVHGAAHYEWVASLAEMSEAELRRLSREMDSGKQSVYVGGLSWLAASISAAGAIETCRQVVARNARNAFAIIRPPGHHAEWDHAMGFCLFNNVSIGVRVCQKEFPDTCRKVLILDWDVHHGNGVQNFFYSDPSVLYISLHVWQDGRFYPGMPDNPQEPNAGIDCVGSGNGVGRNVNIAWHDQGMGDGEYMAAFQKIVMPIANEFDPDLVVISAGFDAAQGDELGGCEVTPACYAHMTHMLMGLAKGKVAVCLEGGYNLEAISKSAVAVAKTLMGHPPPRIHAPAKINRDAATVLVKVQSTHAPYWDCMRAGVLDTAKVYDLEGSRLHDVLRDRQVAYLREKYLMMPVYIHREELYRSYENQVLVTPGLGSAKRVLVIIHDPPQLFGQPDPISEPLANGLEGHNTWMIDGVSEYTEWAIQNSFGVMDINVPPYITNEDDVDMTVNVKELSDTQLEDNLEYVMSYVWDNFLQCYDDNVDIFIVGVGRAYLGIRALLLKRECRSKIQGLVGFVTSTLRPVKSETDHDLASWYHAHTRLYLPRTHPCFSNDKYLQMIRRRRYGSLVESPHMQLTGMTRGHAADVQEWILDRTRALVGDGADQDEEDKNNASGESTDDDLPAPPTTTTTAAAAALGQQ